MRTRDQVVKSYVSPRAMQRGIDRMAQRGYTLQSQSGGFTRNPFALRWNRRRVTAVFARAD